jgi:hypothetical protein
MEEGARQYRWLLWAALVVMVATAGLSPVAPWGSGIPARDSSAFLYVGKVWAETGQGYVAAWDNKGPALFGLEALAHLVSPRLGLGSWILDLLSYCGTVLILGSVVRRLFGDLVAGWSVLLMSATLAVTVQMGNYTEGFCLPLIAAGIWLSVREKQNWLHWLACATLILVAGLMRVNNAVGLALICFVGPMLLGLEGRKLRWEVAGIGVLLLVGFLAGYRGVMGSREFDEMVYAMWGFNQSYASVGITGKFQAILQVFFNLTNPVLLVGILAIPFAKGMDKRVWLWFGIFWLQVVAMGIGGRTYMHYSVVLLPIAAVLMGFVLSHFEKVLRSRVWLGVLVVLGVLLPYALGVAAWKRGDRDDAGVRATVAALKGVEGRSLYVWGHQASINLLDGRRWRSPMFAESVFLIPNPRRGEYVREFVELWRADPPEVVVFQREQENLEDLGVDVGRYEVLPERFEGQWRIGVLRR